MTSSLLPTSSLLCALEKLGYGRDVFEPQGEEEEALRSSSGIGIEDLRFGVGVLVVDDLAGLTSSLSLVDLL